jgi:RimJ/RimL family protein N-acetyltransferase
MQIIAETERLVLRRFTLGDVDDLLALDNDPLVRRFVEDGEPVNAAQATRDIEYWLDQYERSDHFGCWVAATKGGGDPDNNPDSEFIGWLHLYDRTETPGAPELGYRLVSKAWGQGFAAEGCRTLIDRVFQATDVHRVVAETMVIHRASRRVMEQCGMRLVREFRADWPVKIEGDEHGDVEYAITRDEWQARSLVRRL